MIRIQKYDREAVALTSPVEDLDCSKDDCTPCGLAKITSEKRVDDAGNTPAVTRKMRMIVECQSGA